MGVKIIDLDIWNQSWQYASAVKLEVNSRFLEIHFYQDSQPYDLTNKTIDAFTTKPDGTFIDNTVDILDDKNGIAAFKLTSQVSAVVGTLNFLFNIRGNSPISNETVTGLHLEILEGMNETPVTSDNQFTVLQTALGSVQPAVENINTAIVNANAATNAANNAAELATNTASVLFDSLYINPLTGELIEDTADNYVGVSSFNLTDNGELEVII